jgi:tetratricopeptide (TPR) repeat protein
MNERQPLRVAEQYPGIDTLIRATRGDATALGHLEQERPGLYIFARAFTGDAQALDRLRSDEELELGDLFEAIQDDGLLRKLGRRHRGLHQLFEAVEGDPDALRALAGARKKPALAPLAQVLGDLYAKHLYKEAGGEEISRDAAADMGCLVGDLHLQQGNYHKAVEAFSRAIATNPTIDAYEGRAKAYHGLAEQDERMAGRLKPE